MNSGDSSAAVNSGYRSAAVNSGDSSAAVNSGDSSAAVNSGYRSAAVNSGDSSAAEVTGMASVAMVCGIEGRVKGALGCALFAVEREWDVEHSIYAIKSVAAGFVDGIKFSPDKWYICRDGELVEFNGDSNDNG